jgi:hypothetical protein
MKTPQPVLGHFLNMNLDTQISILLSEPMRSKISHGIPSCASSHSRSLAPALLAFLAGIKNRNRAVKRTAVVSDKTPVLIPYLSVRWRRYKVIGA